MNTCLHPRVTVYRHNPIVDKYYDFKMVYSTVLLPNTFLLRPNQGKIVTEKDWWVEWKNLGISFFSKEKCKSIEINWIY